MPAVDSIVLPSLPLQSRVAEAEPPPCACRGTRRASKGCSRRRAARLLSGPPVTRSPAPPWQNRIQILRCSPPQWRLVSGSRSMSCTCLATSGYTGLEPRREPTCWEDQGMRLQHQWWSGARGRRARWAGGRDGGGGGGRTVSPRARRPRGGHEVCCRYRVPMASSTI